MVDEVQESLLPKQLSEKGGDIEDQGGSRSWSASRHQYASPFSFQWLPRKWLAIFVLVDIALVFLTLRHLSRPAPIPESPKWTLDELFQTGNIDEHNAEVAARLDRCASLGMLRNTSLPLEPGSYIDPKEEARYGGEGCGLNETTVIVLSDYYFAHLYQTGCVNGECIFAQSVMAALNAYNYSWIVTPDVFGAYNEGATMFRDFWQKYRWNVRLFLTSKGSAEACWDNAVGPCIKSEDNPEGIEPWRMISWTWWNVVDNPLGSDFTLSPTPSSDNHLLSYSVEPWCKDTLAKIPKSRMTASPPRAYVYTKYQFNLTPDRDFAWSLPLLSQLQEDLDISVTVGTAGDSEDVSRELEEMGIKDYGLAPKEEFYSRIAGSFAILGAGYPRISPSPWDALCLGTPYINPILEWDENDPWDRSKWLTQQQRMNDLNPPYVYHVHAHNETGLEAAFEAALNNPIESFIPDYMKFDFILRKMDEILDGDWKSKAADILEERLRTGEGRLFVL